jgi:hypothetical protein
MIDILGGMAITTITAAPETLKSTIHGRELVSGALG